ncbi:MAG: hypothetical protein M3Z36_10800 [Acidobacteriota bacterium]|nr:hypothetical protein [Acidobacteriota bacterium]
MNFRRLAAFILGVWIAGSVLMDVVAIQNFHSVDRLIAEPGAAAPQVRAIGHDQVRLLLRRHAAEQNRWYFENWERVQFGIALCLGLVLLFGVDPNKFRLLLCMLMFLIVAADRFILTPEIITLGRAVDYVPAYSPSGERDRFGTFHGIYSSLELAKIGMGFFLTGALLLRRRHDRGRFARNADALENPITTRG